MKVESKLGSVKKVHFLEKQKQKAQKLFEDFTLRFNRDSSSESAQAFQRKKGNIFYGSIEVL
mgnify:CR=1 FL=1